MLRENVPPPFLPTSMSPSPYRPRDIVRVVASVDRTLRSFFYDNSHLSAMSGTATSTTPIPGTSKSTSSQNQFRGGPARPGVILGLSTDFATVAMFTTLQGKGLSQVKGALRPVMATVLPGNKKRDHETPGWLPTLTVHPTWRNPATAKHTLCLCLKHQVPIEDLEPWRWKGESMAAGEGYKMCGDDFKLLLQLCEKNEGLRGLFASEGWLFEELGLIDFARRRG